MSAPTKHQLGQMRHLDLLALAFARDPRGDERRYGAMSKDGLISVLAIGGDGE